MKRRLFPLLLALSLLCPILPAAAEDGDEVPVTALCVAEPGQSVFLDEKEFQLLCRQATGHDLESVTFSSLSAGAGKLTFQGERVKAEDAYYMYRRPAISQVCFTSYDRTPHTFTGQAEMAFTMTSDEEETVSGTLIFYVPEPPAAPEETSSHMDKTITVKAGEPVDLCDYLPSTAEYTSRGTSLFHEEITSAAFDLPFSSQGALWMDYDDPDTAHKLLPDQLLFPDRAPNYHCLFFVPSGKEEGQVTLTYTVHTPKKRDLKASLTLVFKEKLPPDPPAVPHAAQPPAVHFTDMAGWEWATSAAEFLAGHGFPAHETAFSPGEAATRIDLIHALALTAYSRFEPNADSPDFPDLPDDPALCRSAAIAAERRLVLGDGEGRLLPDASITRQDALVILYRAMADRGKLLPLYGDLSAFSDAGDVAPYAREAVTLLAARGIVLGNGAGRLDPLSPITRAEMACLLHRAFE